MRGRYNSEGKTEQQIEVRDDQLCNALTTVTKDSLVVKICNRTNVSNETNNIYKK